MRAKIFSFFFIVVFCNQEIDISVHAIGYVLYLSVRILPTTKQGGKEKSLLWRRKLSTIKQYCLIKTTKMSDLQCVQWV